MCSKVCLEFQIYQRHEEQHGSTHVRTHTHIVLARIQYEENRPAHLVLHTRDKQLKVRRMQGISIVYRDGRLKNGRDVSGAFRGILPVPVPRDVPEFCTSSFI